MENDKTIAANGQNPFNIYLPQLPELSSKDIALYTNNVLSRLNLVTLLDAAGMAVSSINGANSWLKTMGKHADQSDAFIFPPMTSLKEDHPKFKAEAAQRWFEFFSLVTGVHVGNREKFRNGLSKPCVIMDPDKQWQSKAIYLLDYLKEMGMFTSNVSDIIQIADTGGLESDANAMNKKAVEALQKTIAERKGKQLHSIEKLQNGPHDSFRKEIKRHDFGVAFFGSATTTENSYIKATEVLTRLLGQRGWRMITGAGCRGCMGAADRGFEEGRKEFYQQFPDAPYKPAHIGVSTQSILQLEGPPAYLDQLIITEDIYDRMMVMIRGQKSQIEKERLRDGVKVAFVGPGGTGTLHEFATMMQLATNGDMMRKRKVVLLDFPRHKELDNNIFRLKDTQKGFWEPLIAIAKDLGFADYFIIAKSPQDAIEIADQEYKKWLERNPEHKDLPHPLFNA